MIPIQESFLHYLWQFQQFDRTELRTVQGEALQILQVGRLNTHAGADFVEARLLIGGIEWAGNVEMHLRSSDWNAHAHSQDTAYENVILHVVWEHNQAIYRADGSEIPTLTLHNRTSVHLIAKYKHLIDNQLVIPCASQFELVSEVTKLSMLDKALMQRLEEKAAWVQQCWEANQHDWEETAYQVLARNFGFKLNAEPFLRLAQQVPLKALQKHRDQANQVEALLFGTAGYLGEAPTDDYHATLQKEFQFLSAKYQLKDKVLGKHQWKFLRLRPANFPTIRLSQLAALLRQQQSLFSLFVHTDGLAQLIESLRVSQLPYWQQHYLFGKKAEGKVASLGKSSVQNLIINTAIPLLVAYSQQQGNRQWLDKAISYLEQLPGEQNHITALWEGLGLKTRTAFDSQAVIELYNHFCTPRRCLQCGIGVALLKS
ncbi:MAG: DUF2851 family protein [Spirosomataceae bacterium]